MRTTTAVLATATLLVGCSAAPSASVEEPVTAATCDYDGAGGGCPTPKPPLFSDTPITLRCPDDASLLPAPRELKYVTPSQLWNGHHGVLVSYFTPDTDTGDRSRVQVFGVDVKNRQVIFSVFASTTQVAPYFYLQNATGSDLQQPNCPSAQGPPIEQGTASAGKPPGDPPPTSGGPICGDGPCFCTTDFIIADAIGRACP